MIMMKEKKRVISLNKLSLPKSLIILTPVTQVLNSPKILDMGFSL